MKINLHSPIEEVQIQIIPLIDVIFCILTFFLLAALQFTRQQSISVDLPKARTGTTPQMRQMLIVTIDSIGQIYVEQQPVKFEQLPQTLQTYHQANPAGMMVLNASRSSSYNDVVQVLDKMREVGGDRVALATLPGPSDQPVGSSAVSPYTPSVPGVTPEPGTSSVYPLNPLGTPNPAIPSVPGQLPLPTIPGQRLDAQGINPVNPSMIPVIPTAPTPQATASPRKTNSAPKR